jgi:hypothetical protein
VCKSRFNETQIAHILAQATPAYRLMSCTGSTGSRLLGVGSMGRVYKGVHPTVRRETSRNCCSDR